MRNFFHGWRRKMGAVTLLVACVFMGLALRSHAITDRLSNDFGGHEKYFEALLLEGDLIVSNSTYDYSTFDGRISFPFPRGIAFEQLSPDIARHDWMSKEFRHQGCLGIERSHLSIPLGDEVRLSITDWRVSMMWTIIPLTLFSAYLLLSKPRSKPKQQVNHA